MLKKRVKFGLVSTLVLGLVGCSNMSKEEWDKHKEWVFSFMGEIIEKKVLH